MKLTVIGCWGGYPKKNEASTGYLLEADDFKLLIDCGSGVLSKLQNFVPPEKLNAVILSHYHPDHIADIGVLQHARLIQGLLKGKPDTLPIYANSANQSEFKKLTYKDITKGVAYQPENTINIGPFTIRFLLTNHPVPCYAMRIETGGSSIVYTGDTAYKKEFISFAKDTDILLSECNFYAHQDGKNAGHMNSTDAGILAQSANAGKLILTHLPHYGDVQQLAQEASNHFTGEIVLAEEGLTVTL